MVNVPLLRHCFILIGGYALSLRVLRLLLAECIYFTYFCVFCLRGCCFCSLCSSSLFIFWWFPPFDLNILVCMDSGVPHFGSLRGIFTFLICPQIISQEVLWFYPLTFPLAEDILKENMEWGGVSCRAGWRHELLVLYLTLQIDTLIGTIPERVRKKWEFEVLVIIGVSLPAWIFYFFTLNQSPLVSPFAPWATPVWEECPPSWIGPRESTDKRTWEHAHCRNSDFASDLLYQSESQWHLQPRPKAGTVILGHLGNLDSKASYHTGCNWKGEVTSVIICYS